MSLITKCAFTVAVLCIMLSAFTPAQADSSLAGKKLIELGWDYPSPAYVRQHIDEMQKIPLDGLTIDTGKGRKAWSRTRFTPGELQPIIDDLKATKFGRFTDNFIEMVTYFPTHQDEMSFFDPDWPSITYNAACLARVAKETGCKGILFDPEEYNRPALGVWTDDGSQVNKGHSYEAYVAKARERGHEFIRAMCKEYPDITIIVLHGYEQTIDYRAPVYAPSYHAPFSLQSAFMDGMCEAAAPGMTLVDGFEDSYGYIAPKLFKKGRDKILNQGREKSLCPAAYAQHVRMGFAVWVDFQSGTPGFEFNSTDISKNPLSPGAFRAALANAMSNSDKYVWVYSERLRWWGWWQGTTPPADAPAQYIEALALAKQGAGPGKYPAKLGVDYSAPKASEVLGYDDAATFAEMKKTMTEVYDFPKDGWKLKFRGIEYWGAGWLVSRKAG